MADITFVSGTTVTSAWLNAANKATYTAANMTALRALVVSDGASVTWLRGYSEAFDGGEGIFVYDSTSSASDNVGTIVAPDSGSGRWRRLTFGEPHNVKWYGATGNGSTDDTVALQRALDNSLSILVPAGTYKVTDDLTLRDGHRIVGVGRTNTIFSKSNYAGAVFLGIDTDYITIESLSITGPGFAVGSSNKGIDLHVSSNEIITNIRLQDVTVSAMNDTGIYIGTGFTVNYENVRCTDCGFAGIWVDGGDSHTFDSCNTKNTVIGFYVNNPTGFGPTTIVFNACYAEQAGAGFKLNDANNAVLNGCGVEAPIDRAPNAEGGYSYWIRGGEDIQLIGCIARNDTIGAAITVPFVLVDNSATRVRIDSFRKEVSVTYGGPTVELHASAATSVSLGFSNFDLTKITSGGKIQYTVPLTGSATFNAANLADGAGETTTVTVTGAALGDFAEAALSVALAGITVNAWVSAADTVSVRFQNETTGAVDLASGTLRARVWKV